MQFARVVEPDHFLCGCMFRRMSNIWVTQSFSYFNNGSIKPKYKLTNINTCSISLNESIFSLIMISMNYLRSHY